jgi:hypothetical protein
MASPNQATAHPAFHVGKWMAEIRQGAIRAWLDDCDDTATSRFLQECGALIFHLEQALAELTPRLSKGQLAKSERAADKIKGFWKTFKREWENPNRAAAAEKINDLDSDLIYDAQVSCFEIQFCPHHLRSPPRARRASCHGNKQKTIL